MKRKRYSTKRQLHDLALILSNGEEWRRLGIYYDLQRCIIVNGRKWITEGQAREWLNGGKQ
ncbi:hypothetical protein IGK47_004721 [Enterococcus sp. AZ007]